MGSERHLAQSGPKCAKVGVGHHHRRNESKFGESEGKSNAFRFPVAAIESHGEENRCSVGDIEEWGDFEEFSDSGHSGKFAQQCS